MKQARFPAQWYGRLSTSERAKLWTLAVERGDQDDADALRRSCPRVIGSVCDPGFVAEAGRSHPERVVELMDLELHEPQQMNVTIRVLPNTKAEYNELVRAGEIKGEIIA